MCKCVCVCVVGWLKDVCVGRRGSCSQRTYLVDPAWARAIRERLTDRFVLIARRVNNAQKIIADESAQERFATTAQSEQKRAVEMGSRNSSKQDAPNVARVAEWGLGRGLPEKSLAGKTTHRMIIRSRDSSNHGTNKIVPVDNLI